MDKCNVKGCDRERNPKRRRCRRCDRIRVRYKISDEYIDHLLQTTHCSICENELVDTPHHERQFCVDHCHTTGNVREAICRKCNLLLGYSEDNVKILLNAIKYLKTWGNSEEVN